MVSNGQQDFDIQRYYGDWLEIAVDKYTYFELFSDCVGANYSENDEGATHVLNTAYISWYGWFGGEGTAYQLDPVESKEGSLYVTFGDD